MGRTSQNTKVMKRNHRAGIRARELKDLRARAPIPNPPDRSPCKWAYHHFCAVVLRARIGNHSVKENECLRLSRNRRAARGDLGVPFAVSNFQPMESSSVGGPLLRGTSRLPCLCSAAAMVRLRV